ncbi:MAG: DUF1631 family protein [Oxalobacteraceae bacterium]
MDRNDLLNTTRAEFLRLFSQAMSDLVQRSMDQFFNKADNFYSSNDQGLFLDARSVLSNRNAELRQKMIRNMEQLINRSFQTAYSNFRPSFSSVYNSDQFTLVDSAVMEDELRIDAMTRRFRNEAEEQLRDLNIRVALLLEQDNIKERENPFRPYLFSRCIALTTESLGIPPALIAVLSEQLALDLANNIANIYNGINAHLAQHGIAAQLQLKIRKDPDQCAGAATSNVIRAVADDYPPGASDQNPQRFSPPAITAQRSGGDRFFEMIKGIAGNAGEDAGAAIPHQQTAAARQAVPSGGAAARSGWHSGTQMLGEALRAFFSGQSAPRNSIGKTDTFSAPYPPSRLTRSVQGLLHENTPNGDEMLGANGAVRNLVAEQRASLNEKTRNHDEQMTIDIVAMLFEFILRDSQIPAEVRAQLGRLQFLVLKVALQEPELLTRKNHPARMMVNRIGSISVGLKQVDPTGARITAEISRIVEALLTDEAENSQLFSQMLDELDAFIARELRFNDAQVDRAARAVEKAESRSRRFARTTTNISAVLNGLSIAPFLHNFFVVTWAHAIERAGRTDSGREKRFKQLIADLLWSIVPKVTGQDRAQLLALLPLMLLELRDGLTLAGQDQKQQQEILDWLVDAHTQAMRCGSGVIASNVPSLSATHEHFEPFIAQTEEIVPVSLDGEQYVSDGNFIQEAVQELGIDLQVVDSTLPLNPWPGQADHDGTGNAPAVATEIPASGSTIEEDSDIMARLRSGVMVEINLDGTWSQGRLSWISTNTLHLLLSIGQNNTLSAIGRPMLRRLLATGRARFLEAAPLFERAVQSLLQSADRIDGSAN